MDVSRGPNWYPDPSGRFHLRYWSGQSWTNHVSDSAGNRSIDHDPPPEALSDEAKPGGTPPRPRRQASRKAAIVITAVSFVTTGIVIATLLTGANSSDYATTEATTTVASSPKPIYTTTVAPATTAAPRQTTTTTRRVSTTTIQQVSAASAQRYGQNRYLDSLYDDCANGDMSACDDLYWDSALGSDYESFGRTCGGTGSQSAGSCGGSTDYSTYLSDYDVALLTWSALSYYDQQEICSIWRLVADSDLVAELISYGWSYGEASELVGLLWTVC